MIDRAATAATLGQEGAGHRGKTFHALPGLDGGKRKQGRYAQLLAGFLEATGVKSERRQDGTRADPEKRRRESMGDKSVFTESFTDGLS